MRIFIAVNIPENIKSELNRLQNKLKIDISDAKWVNPGNLHITLKFIGEIEDSKINSLISAVENAVKNIKPFDINLKGLGAFPNNRYQKVLWVAITKGDDLLKQAAKIIEDELLHLGFNKEERGFSAHLTIARIKKPTSNKTLQDMIEGNLDKIFGEFTVKSVDIMQSILKSAGPEYKCLKSISV